MSHKHPLTTFSPDFVINAQTREVTQVNVDALITLMQYDHNSESLRFQCPRFIDGHDMSLCNKVEVHFVNSDVAGGTSKGGYYTVTDLAVSSSDPSLVNFSWVVSRNSTENVGTLVFSVRFTCTTGNTIDYVWHTMPFSYVSVDQGLVAELDPSYQEVYLDNLETEAAKKVVEAGNATTTALEAAERASEAISDLYSMDVTDKAPAIVCEASGEVISITDSATMPLKGLRLFGKSTQDGTPTPTAPVEIVSVENPVVGVYGKNLLKETEIPKTMTGSGITCDYEGNGVFHIYGTHTCEAQEIQLSGTNLYIPVDNTANYSLAVKLLEGTHPATFHFFLGLASDTVSFRNWFSVPLEQNTTVGTLLYDTRRPVDALGDATQVSRFWIYNYNGDKTAYTVDFRVQIWLEKENNPTAYEPYTGQTFTLTTSNILHGVPVASGGNYTDSDGQQWICDEVDLERGVYVQRVKYVVFDGSEDELWKRDYTSDASKRRMTTTILTDTIKKTANNRIANIICNRFVKARADDTYSLVERISVDDLGRVHIYHNAYNDAVETWTEFLASNHLEIVCELAETVETHLTETEIAAYKALHTNKPNTIILNDSGAWQSVDYVADTKLYIDNKFAELANR